jgi:predicted S18 family serine protease
MAQTTLMSVRVAAGVAHRVSGTDGSKATIFTWSIGVQLPLTW